MAKPGSSSGSWIPFASAAEQTPAAPPPDSWSRAARCAIAYLSPPAAAPSVTPPLQADDQAASSPLRFSPFARVFTSPADPLCRTLELGQLAEMQKSPALSVEQLCSNDEKGNERAIADELVVLAAMDPESLAFSDGTNASHILLLHS